MYQQIDFAQVGNTIKRKVSEVVKRQPTRLQACWMQQGAMMRWCGLTQFDADATVAKWQRRGYEYRSGNLQLG